MSLDRRAARRALMIRLRMIVVALVFLGGLGKVVGRAWDLQVVQADELREMAERQYVRRIHIPAKRGAIYDRSMGELAVSVRAPSIHVNGRRYAQEEGRNLGEDVRRIASILEMEPEEVERALTADRHFLWLRRWVPPEQGEQISELRVPGVEITYEARRYYPNRELAGHLLGFAGIDSQGLEGLERMHDELLQGQQEGIRGLRDARGRLVFSEDLMTDQTPEGHSLVLTIDRTIQHIAEEELAAAVRTFEARAGMVVIVDPRTGEILAIANEPTFNPNNFSAYRPEQWRNRAIHDQFEPGSTFKIFTIAAALNAGTIRPDETVFCENGRMMIADYTIHDSHRDGWLSVAQVLGRSSNIGTARIALEVGRPTFYRYLRRFGFGERTGIDLPGESSGRLSHWRSWYDIDVATISFGQGVGVSTLQLAMATAAIADGGRLHRPMLIRQILGPDGSVVREFTPEVRRRVVSRQTARLVADMMTTVTEEGGTGTDAALEGYLVAGKTGTAQVADLEHGGYAEDAWISSFVGFVPADRPRLAMAVVLVEPVINHYGGQTAGPAFRRIADQALRYLGVPPNRAEVDRRRQEQRQAASRANDAEGAEAEEALVDEAAAEGEAEVEVEENPDWPEMPDFSGMSMRRALTFAAEQGLSIIVEGTGRAVEQAPAAGRRVDPERRPVVRFEAPVAVPIADERVLEAPVEGEAPIVEEEAEEEEGGDV